MKVGTLVQHHKWGKGIVTEVLEGRPFAPIRVAWLKEPTSPFEHRMATRLIWQKETIILSEGE